MYTKYICRFNIIIIIQKVFIFDEINLLRFIQKMQGMYVFL